MEVGSDKSTFARSKKTKKPRKASGLKSSKTFTKFRREETMMSISLQLKHMYFM